MFLLKGPGPERQVPGSLVGEYLQKTAERARRGFSGEPSTVVGIDSLAILFNHRSFQKPDWFLCFVFLLFLMDTLKRFGSFEKNAALELSHPTRLGGWAIAAHIVQLKDVVLWQAPLLESKSLLNISTLGIVAKN